MAELDVIIVDDHPIFADGMATMVSQLAPSVDVKQVGTKDALEALLVDQYKLSGGPDLLILDVMFPGFDPERDLDGLRQRLITTVIVVVSMIENHALIDFLVNQGINGFIAKSSSPEEMRQALTAIMEGDVIVLKPEAFAKVSANSEISNLSPRQREVLGYLSKGMSNKEIAKAMQLSPFTVRVHVSAVLSTLGVATRTAAAAIAAKEELP